jgi:hypothetical protein
MYFRSAPNYYSLPGMLGKTIQSSKKQAPAYTVTGRSKIGSFHEDLQKVMRLLVPESIKWKDFFENFFQKKDTRTRKL